MSKSRAVSYLSFGAFVYVNDNVERFPDFRKRGNSIPSLGVRRMDREDVAPFDEIDMLSGAHNFLGCCHAVLGQENVRVCVLAPYSVAIVTYQHWLDDKAVVAYCDIRKGKLDRMFDINNLGNRVIASINNDKLDVVLREEYALSTDLLDKGLRVWTASCGFEQGGGWDDATTESY